MKKTKTIIPALLMASAGVLGAANPQQTVQTVSSTVTLGEPTDYHVLSADDFGTGTVDLAHEDAWLFLDSIRPRTFFEQYADQVTVNGQALDITESQVTLGEGAAIPYTTAYAVANARVHVYRHGTVIIPHDSTYAAITLYDAANCTGNAHPLISSTRHRGLGDFDDKAQSFLLKRGYMATLAVKADGRGFSRVYVADTADVRVDQLPAELAGKVSTVSVFNWQWPNKRGWCSSGLNAYNEIDLTESTWWYSWSADRPALPNQEYVPIKQNGGWPSTGSIENTQSVTHLLGANEPDRPEQANQTVEQALDGWETLMATGLRLGSPAIADQTSWLYNFMDGAEARGYRVDFVAIHAYWGGSGGAYYTLGSDGKPDINKWYNHLKDIHDRTGRPLWITEWNNGANWTDGGEAYWADNLEEQWEQNDEIMQEILHMLDTCSFVERYSLYNWVGDRRRAVMEAADGSQYLTPMGETYAGSYPPFAYNPANEVIHTYTPLTPTLEGYCRPGCIRLDISDWNGEMTDSFVLERRVGSNAFEEVLSGDSVPQQYYDSTITAFSQSTKVEYRLTVRTGEVENTSNTVSLVVGVVGGTQDIRPATASFGNTNTQYFYVQHPYAEIPVVVTGGVSNKNGRKTVPVLSNISPGQFNFQLKGWEYSGNPSLSSAEDVSLLVAPAGTLQWGGLQAEAGKITNLTQDWQAVTFAQPFASAPVVFADATANTGSAPYVARVRNVTNTGFEIRLTCENTGRLRANVNWLAVQQGETTVNGHRITVATLPAVGQLSRKGQVDLSGYNDPMFMAAIQTNNDEAVYNVRYNRERGATTIDVFKDAAGRPQNAQDDVMGYVIAEEGVSSFLSQAQAGAQTLRVYPSPAHDYLMVEGLTDCETVKVVNMTGETLLQDSLAGGALDVSDLPQGIYLLYTVQGNAARFVKN